MMLFNFGAALTKKDIISIKYNSWYWGYSDFKVDKDIVDTPFCTAILKIKFCYKIQKYWKMKKKNHEWGRVN